MGNTVGVNITAAYTELQTAFTKARDIIGGVCDGMRQELKFMSEQAKVETKNYESSLEQLGNVVQARFKGINGAIAGAKAAWAQLAVVVGAGLAANRAVEDAAKYTVEITKLARGMGITTQAASGLAMALGDVHSTSDEFLQAAKGLDQQVRTHEKTLNAMGLATRDSNGELRNQQDLMLSAIELLRGYKEGTDRNLAAQKLFGEGFKASSEMLNLTADALERGREKAEELNMVVGEQSTEAAEEYRGAMGDLGDVLEAVKVTIGNALMPLLTQLAEWLSDIGPTAIMAIRIALNILIALFRGLALAVKVVWEIVSASFKSMADTIGAFGDMFRAVLSGNFGEASEAGRRLFESLKSNAGAAFDNIVAAASDAGSKTVDSFTGLLNPGARAGAQGGSSEGKSFTDPDAEERARKAALAAAKKHAAELKKLRDDAYKDTVDRLKDELEAWRFNYDERLKIAEKIQAEALRVYGAGSVQYREASQRILDIERAKAAQLRALQDQQAEYAEEHRLADIEAERAAADFEVDLGRMTCAERIQVERDFEERTYQLKAKALQDRLALMELDPDHNPVLLAQIKEELYQVEAQHAERVKQLQRDAVLEARAPLQEMTQQMRQGWSQTLAGMLTGQVHWREGLKQIWNQALGSFTQFLAKKLATSKMFATLEIALQKMVAAILRALGFQSAADGIAAKTRETTVKVGQSAAAAGAGAAESQAGIPIVGPVLAIAAMAAIFAAVMALGKGGGGGGGTSIPSARGGWDVPAGLNPLTRIHEKEMVLPEGPADALRDIAERGGAGGDVHLHVHALDRRDVESFLRRHSGSVASAGRNAARDFKTGGKFG